MLWNPYKSRSRKKILKALPQKFGIIFDGWSDGYGHHYVALVAVCEDDSLPLLAMSPFSTEISFRADDHINFINEVLQDYDRDISAVLFVVGDNCPTNISLAKK